MARHKITSSFGFKDFEGTSEESAFWNGASEDERMSLKKKHVTTGICLLCIIDELIPQKTPELEKAIEPEPEEVREQIISRKIAGGIINRTHERAEVSTQNLKVSWAWYNEDQGIVAWTLQNTGSQQATGVLFRNSYYFGNAYWPVYENNPGFGVAFAAKLEPLVDKSIQSNCAPLGIVSWKQADGSYKSIISFVFTLAAGQTWQVLEGGFSRVMPPQNITAYEVSPISESDFCIAYDQNQIDTWDQQTDTSDEGYAPNPNTFYTVQLLAPPEAPFAQLFEDSIQQGTSPASVPKDEGESPIEPAASPAGPASGNESRLWSLLSKHSGSLGKD
ncbi:MAG: hypothetical protein PXY39_12220 [archaeon]|nr:hypothetical protein [archaeon]